MKYPSIPMSEIRDLYRPGQGRHWFDKTTMSFFNSKLPVSGWATPHGNFFITAETNPSGVKAYSLRCQSLSTGNIVSVGDFHRHKTQAEAKQALAAHLQKMQATQGEPACT